MPTQNIPGTPPFQPPIPDTPETSPPAQGRTFTLQSTLVDESGYLYERYVNVSRSQKWRREFVAFLDCKQKLKTTRNTKVGVSRTDAAEVSSKLGVEVDGLGAELGAKLSTSITITFEQQDSFDIETTAPNCKKRTFVLWQLIDVYDVEIIDEWSGWPPDFTFTFQIEVPLKVYDPDEKDYDSAECCPQEVAFLKQDGFREVYAVRFNEAAFVLLGKTTEDGRISFANMVGSFQPGGLIPYTALSIFLKSAFKPLRRLPELTFGTFTKLGDPAALICNEVNLTNQAGFVRTEARVLDLFNNADRETFLAATLNASATAVDKVIAARSRGPFRSIKDIEAIENLTEIEGFQLLLPIVTRGDLTLPVPESRGMPVGGLQAIEGVGPRTAERLVEAGFSTLQDLAGANRSTHITGVREFGYLVDSARVALDLTQELNQGLLSFQDVQVVATLYCSLSAALKSTDTADDMRERLEALSVDLPKDYDVTSLFNLIKSLREGR